MNKRKYEDLNNGILISIVNMGIYTLAQLNYALRNWNKKC